MNKSAKPKNDKPVNNKSEKNDRQKSKEKSEKTEKVVKKNSSKDKKTDKENGPKRNKNAYMFFTDEMRPKVVKEKPDLKAKEVMSVNLNFKSAYGPALEESKRC
jgi:hypothetical protein